MMTSSNVRGIHRSPVTKASDAQLWCFLWCAPEQTNEQVVEMPVIWDDITLIVTSLLCHGVIWKVLMTYGSLLWSNSHPVGTRRNNNVIMTSKGRRFDVIMTLLLRHVPAGILYTYRYDDRTTILLYAMGIPVHEKTVCILKQDPWWLFVHNISAQVGNVIILQHSRILVIAGQRSVYQLRHLTSPVFGYTVSGNIMVGASGLLRYVKF